MSCFVTHSYSESGKPVDLENNFVQALQRCLGTQITANVKECTDKCFHGAIGRTAVPKARTNQVTVEIDEGRSTMNY